MKERPILFSGPMVRAILEGMKTMTRRVVKPQPDDALFFQGWIRESTFSEDEGKAMWVDKYPCASQVFRARCPYGQPGDRLWVRETFFDASRFKDAPLFSGLGGDFIYRADYREGCDRSRVIGCHKWQPSIHMPRRASRITLEITRVRVERLNQISEADAQWEGCERLELSPPFIEMNGQKMPVHPMTSEYRVSFEALWESINGPGSWALNPWVWVVEFRRLTSDL